MFVPEWFFFTLYFFSQNCARNLGVWLVYDCGLYMSFYSMYKYEYSINEVNQQCQNEWSF